ncbi:hypothetical protein C8R44DRAFT_737481 [Mycena epipterygia]|nr:hypothetical protein C8R44DRAFT_737481 [Mycena epipterygia]
MRGTWISRTSTRSSEHPDPAKYEPLAAYNQAKSANILFIVKLSRRSRGAIHGYSISPGVVFTNAQQRPESFEILFTSGIITATGQPNHDNYKWKKRYRRTQRPFDPHLDEKPGIYLDDCNEAPITGPNISDPAALIGTAVVGHGENHR